jgi:hypothetical protein
MARGNRGGGRVAVDKRLGLPSVSEVATMPALTQEIAA